MTTRYKAVSWNTLQASGHGEDFIILHGVTVDLNVLTLDMVHHAPQHGGEVQGGGNEYLLLADPHLPLPSDGQGPGGGEQEGGGGDGEPGLDQPWPAGQPGQQATHTAEYHNHPTDEQAVSETKIC